MSDIIYLSKPHVSDPVYMPSHLLPAPAKPKFDWSIPVILLANIVVFALAVFGAIGIINSI
jgi:hypothetical protein